MHTEINMFPIFHTAADRKQVREWLNRVGASEFELPSEDDDVTDCELLVTLAGRRCYNSFVVGLNPNITRIRQDWCDYIDNILSSRHGSVLEHATYTWAIEGCTRVFTAEMNRHRAGCGISEGSLRYIRFQDDIPWWMPFSIRAHKLWTEGMDIASWERALGRACDAKHISESWIAEVKKEKTRRIFNDVMRFVTSKYAELVSVWELDNVDKFGPKKIITSMMRRIIPMGVATGGLWTMNLRSLRHIIATRCREEAEEEICYIMSHIAKHMIENETKIFSDFEYDENGCWRPKHEKV